MNNIKGNDGTNETSFKVLIKDANYNFSDGLDASDIMIRVRDLGSNTVWESAYGENITIDAAPVIYGPVQEGTEIMNGRYYTITAKNIEQNGTIFLVFKTGTTMDKAGNTVEANAVKDIVPDQFELATDVYVEHNKPTITITSDEISIQDTDGNAMNMIKVDGQSITLTNGKITRAALQTKYGITLQAGMSIETIDRCGNVAHASVN